MLYIIDFDKVLFRNKYGQFYKEYLTEDKIINKEEFEEKLNIKIEKSILLTGRGIGQKDIILDLLSKKGWYFNRTIFRKWGIGNPISYMKRYWEWKIKEIININNKYESTIIDDDPIIIKRCKELNINTIFFNLN